MKPMQTTIYRLKVPVNLRGWLWRRSARYREWVKEGRNATQQAVQRRSKLLKRKEILSTTTPPMQHVPRSLMAIIQSAPPKTRWKRPVTSKTTPRSPRKQITSVNWSPRRSSQAASPLYNNSLSKSVVRCVKQTRQRAWWARACSWYSSEMPRVVWSGPRSRRREESLQMMRISVRVPCTNEVEARSTINSITIAVTITL